MSTTNKPSQTEDEFFAKEDATRLHNQAIERARQMKQADLESLKKQHWMHCPKDGFELTTIKFKGLAIDKCFHCNGTWLDAGELETLAGRESDVLKRIVSVFKRS